MSEISISVIISTYNSPEWLAKVLHGYNNQTYQNFEVVIADDGSKKETIDLIEAFKKEMFYPITHVWHEDNGFQKSQILNKAIVKCQADYILMSDGDCIPREDFVEIHFREREIGYFLSGGYFMLPMDISRAITKESILNGDCFNLKWLKSQGLKPSFKNNKLTAKGFKSWFLNAITPTNASWNGHNASGWKKDIIAINGFDERMRKGGRDGELGEEWITTALRQKQIGYKAGVWNWINPRAYRNRNRINKT